MPVYGGTNQVYAVTAGVTVPAAFAGVHRNHHFDTIQRLHPLKHRRCTPSIRALVKATRIHPYHDFFRLRTRHKHYCPSTHYHPYTSCEKGTIENHNGLIRRFLPKGKRVDSYDEDTILGVELWANGLPRKILGYRTPDEAFEAEMDRIFAV